MLELIIWLGALLCPNPKHTVQNHGSCNLIHLGTVTTNADGDDTGGETGGLPHPPPPPPPPPTDD